MFPLPDVPVLLGPFAATCRRSFLWLRGSEIVGPMKAVAEEMDFQLQLLDDVPEAGGCTSAKLLYMRRFPQLYGGTPKWKTIGKSDLNG